MSGARARAPHPRPPPRAALPGEAPRWAWAAAAAAILALVALVFGGALGHPFLPSHDDGPYLVWNEVIRAPLGAAIRGAFTTTPVGSWAPLHLLSHVADHRLWGEWAGGYVLVNLLLHALDAGLLGWLVLRLGGPPLAALAAALLFAVHPVQVEAVAWISQRKTVLSMAFILATLHLWIGYARGTPGRRLACYGLALAAAAAAALSKAVAVVVPAALVLLDLPLGRIRARLGWVTEKVPFALLAAAVAVVTVLAKGEPGSATTVAGHTRSGEGGFAYHGGGPLGTFYTVVTVLPRYLRLLAWPADLSIVYLPPARTRLDAEVLLSLLLLAGLAGAGVLLARRSPRLLCWYGLFFLGLLPVSQIVPQATLMNDRYLYLPLAGAAALGGEALAAAHARLGARAGRALLAAAAALVVALALQARARVPVWRSDVALWQDAVAKAPGSPYAWYNLGRARETNGEDEEALQAYLRARALDPLDADAAVNAGAILLRRGDLARAEPLLESGARLDGTSLEAHYDLGLLRMHQGRFADAAEALQRARALEPAACSPSLLLGHALLRSDRPEQALQVYRQATATGCADPELEALLSAAPSPVRLTPDRRTR